MSVVIKVTNSNGVLQQSGTFVPSNFSQTPIIKVTGSGGTLVTIPSNAPTVQTQAINDLSQYSNTASMLGNDATTYANAINYVQSNYTNSSSLTLSSLTDVSVTIPVTNNSTVVYNSANNKYEVKELSIDGGNF